MHRVEDGISASVAVYGVKKASSSVIVKYDPVLRARQAALNDRLLA